MFVNINAVSRHVEMEEAFGLPKTSNRSYEEIFGCYHVLGETCYWSYRPAEKAWDVKVSDDNNEPNRDVRVPHSPLWSETERLELQDKLRALAYLPQPKLPKKSKWKSRPPFIFEGWLFAWIFDVKRDRWQISPIGRP